MATVLTDTEQKAVTLHDNLSVLNGSLAALLEWQLRWWSRPRLVVYPVAYFSMILFVVIESSDHLTAGDCVDSSFLIPWVQSEITRRIADA